MKKKIIVVMPAYNAALTLEKVYKQISQKIIDEIILIDDKSKDNTIQVAKKLGIRTVMHVKNSGYGANQKTCYDVALRRGATHVIMLHPDGQYDGSDLLAFVEALTTGKGDLILGSRFLGKPHKTPFYKLISIQFLTQLFNIVLKTHLTEANTGYRGFTKKFLEAIPYKNNGNGYIFDPQIIIQAVYFGYHIYEVSVGKDYLKEASSPNFTQSVVHGIENIQLLVQYILHTLKLKEAFFLNKSKRDV